MGGGSFTAASYSRKWLPEGQQKQPPGCSQASWPDGVSLGGQDGVPEGCRPLEGTQEGLRGSQRPLRQRCPKDTVLPTKRSASRRLRFRGGGVAASKPKQPLLSCPLASELLPGPAGRGVVLTCLPWWWKRAPSVLTSTAPSESPLALQCPASASQPLKSSCCLPPSLLTSSSLSAQHHQCGFACTDKGSNQQHSEGRGGAGR